jgi:hypothetical protein
MFTPLYAIISIFMFSRFSSPVRFNLFLTSFFAFSLFVFTSLTLAATSPFVGTPDGVFYSADDCGFVMGQSAVFGTGQVLADFVTDTDQLCFDINGYAYSDSGKNAHLHHSYYGTMDMAWTASSDYLLNVDYITGKWSGVGKFVSLGSSLTPKELSGLTANPYLFFNPETCADDSTCSGADLSSYQVTTDMDSGLNTGDIAGWAWSPGLARWISFDPGVTGGSGGGGVDGGSGGGAVKLYQELPPDTYQILVDVLAHDSGMDGVSTELGPDDVDLTNAPIGDGVDFWRVRVQFLDTLTGTFLGEGDFDSFEMTVNKSADSQLYVDQVLNEDDLLDYAAGPDGIYEGGFNPGVPECDSGTDRSNGYCTMTEADGSESFNYLVRGVPTSNMIGADYDDDGMVDYAGDREGCIWIYQDQEALAGGAQVCPDADEDTDEKNEVFYARSEDRNKYEIDSIVFSFEINSLKDFSIYEYDDTDSGGEALSYESSTETYEFIPDEDEAELSWRPRFLTKGFYSTYGGEDNTQVSSDLTLEQEVRTLGRALTTSDFYETAFGTDWENMTLDYQLEVEDIDDGRFTSSDFYLIMDTTQPKDGTLDNPYRTNIINSSGVFDRSYAMGYGQREDLCGDGTCDEVAVEDVDNIGNPTGEIWFCDEVGASSFSSPICYYGAYLPIQDRRADAGGLAVDGAINVTADESEFFSSQEDDEAFFLGGSIEATQLRNAMLSQFYRYALGESADGCTLDLSSGSLVSRGDCQVMLNGRLVWADGDITIEEGSGTQGVTIVSRGGNIFVDDDVTEQVGLFVIKDEDGTGNVYVHNDVRNAKLNIVADGSLYGYDGSDVTGTPTYSDLDTRNDEREGQLWIEGSVLTRNTAGGSSAGSACGDVNFSVCYPVGDGTKTEEYSVAVEHDLNMIRQFRLCYPYGDDGSIDWDGDLELCEEGQLSDYVDENGDWSTGSLIITGNPASNLPVFAVEGSVLN